MRSHIGMKAWGSSEKSPFRREKPQASILGKQDKGTSPNQSAANYDTHPALNCQLPLLPFYSSATMDNSNDGFEPNVTDPTTRKERQNAAAQQEDTQKKSKATMNGVNKTSLHPTGIQCVTVPWHHAQTTS